MKVALTIAGSDSGAGAGLQADLKTFAALGVYGTSVVTAVTAQSTRGITRSEPVAPSLVRAQLDAVLADFPVVAAKTGMLATAGIVEEVVAALGRVPRVALVVDPVLRATSGAPLLDEAGTKALAEKLLPRAAVVTPNLIEAEALSRRAARTPAEIRDAARAIRDLGPAVVVVKGGHAAGPESVDLVHDADGFHEIRGPRLDTRSTHGTGCTLSAAIAAGLARGESPLDAAIRARRYLEGALASAGPLGEGRGPMHHFHPFYPWGDVS